MDSSFLLNYTKREPFPAIGGFVFGHLDALRASGNIKPRITYFVNNPSLINDLPAAGKRDVLESIRNMASEIETDRDIDLPEGFGFVYLPVVRRADKNLTSLRQIIEEMIRDAHAHEIIQMRNALKNVK